MMNNEALISVIFQVKYKNSHNVLAHFWNNFSHDNVHCHLQKRKMSNSFLINLSLIIDWCPRKRNWSVINFAKVFSSFLERWKYVFIRYAVWRKRIKRILERKATNFQKKKNSDAKCSTFVHVIIRIHAYNFVIWKFFCPRKELRSYI